jgi:hypothetical protein
LREDKIVRDKASGGGDPVGVGGDGELIYAYYFE